MLSLRPSRRGATLLEFAFVLPFMLFLAFFAVDMGRLLLVASSLHDSAAVAARSGARTGNATRNAIQPDFNDGVGNVPTLSATEINATENSLVVLSPPVIAGRNYCTTNDRVVRVTATAPVQFLTPGLGSLLNMFGGNSTLPNSVSIRITGVASCEVVR